LHEKERTLAPLLELVEKPTVFRQFTGFACSSQTRNRAKPQGVGCAGAARLAHELYFIYSESERAYFSTALVLIA